MALGSNQKRFSRTKGLRRFSSIRASSPPPPSKKASSGGSGSKVDGASGGISTSYVMPDRTQAREFIKHISNSSTSSSEFSLSVALSPYLGVDPVPSQTKAPLRKASIVSITSSMKTFPHGEVFDSSSPPLSPGFARQHLPAPSRSRERHSALLDTPRSGIAGIGANGNAREARAALMAVDSEIFSTGGHPMPEPSSKKKPSMLSLRAAAQHEQLLRQSIDFGGAAGSPPPMPTSPALRRVRQDSSSTVLGDGRRSSTLAVAQRESRLASRSTDSFQADTANRAAGPSSTNQQRHGHEGGNGGGLPGTDAMSTLANQIGRRSKSVNKIIGADVANGWQLMWTLATSENADPQPQQPATCLAVVSQPERGPLSSTSVRATEPLALSVAPPQVPARREPSMEARPRIPRTRMGTSKSLAKPEPEASPILPLHLPRTMASPNASSFPAPPRTRSNDVASRRTESSLNSIPSEPGPSQIASIPLDSASTAALSPMLLSTVSVGSVKSIVSAKPQVTEMVAPQRPPRSAKRISVAWRSSAMPLSSSTLSQPSPLRSELGAHDRRSYVPLASTPVQELNLEQALAKAAQPAQQQQQQQQQQQEALPPPKAPVQAEAGDQSFATAFSSEQEKRTWSSERNRPDSSAEVAQSEIDGASVAAEPQPVLERDTLAAQSHEDSYSDLEIVAMTETESGDNSSSNEDEDEAREEERKEAAAAAERVSVHSRSETQHSPSGSNRRMSSGRQRVRSQMGHPMAVPSTSAHSLIEVLADDESARMAADAQWEMLTGTRLHRPLISKAAEVYTTDIHQHYGAHKTEIFTTHRRVSLHGEIATMAVSGEQHGRDQAMHAVEMWRRLAESYEMGELSKMDAVESAPTPAASVMMEDDMSEAPSRRSPDAGMHHTEHIAVLETRRVEINWAAAAAAGSGVVAPSSSSQLFSQLISTHSSQRTALQAGNPHLQSWCQDQAEMGSPSPPGLDFEHVDSESDPSMFDTPMPGAFLPRFSPATTPLPAFSQRTKNGKDYSGDASAMSSQEPSSYDETRHGLGLIFGSNDDITPPSSHGHKSDEPTWEAADRNGNKEDDGADAANDTRASVSFSAADSASVAASDCFESADEGSEADWGSRRHSKESSRRSKTIVVKSSGSSASLWKAPTETGRTSITVEAVASDHPPLVAARALTLQSSPVQEASRVQPSASEKTAIPSPKPAMVERPAARPRRQGNNTRSLEAEKLQNALRAMASASAEEAARASDEYADYPAAAMKRRSMQAAMYPAFGHTPTIPEQEYASFDRPSTEDVMKSQAEDRHASQTQPISQNSWNESPDLDGANSEPGSQTIAQLRFAKANRRRDNVSGSIRNSIIAEEPNEAEVLSARRASKRMSKLGLIDMTSARTAEKSKSITARQRQRLTASMNSTPIMLAEPPSHISWRSKLSVSAFQDLLDEWGPLEMHRQEVLWELCETERSFVQAICSVQKIFALPLRTPEGRWIKGVPCTVARLFDWLQDIFQLHCKIHSVLQLARHEQAPVLINIAERLLRYIPKLEVHQPYLVRFESVMQTIEEMLRSENSVFGQFIKMQMQIPECKSMSFSSLLLKPVQRLMKYPLFFKQLAELTPSTHPDHHATQALLQSTDQVIRDMNDVKAREEDYRDLKALQARIKGLPEGFHLATRERRLLRQGSITSVQLTPREKIQLGLTLTLADIQQGVPHSLPNSPLMGFRTFSASSSEAVRDGSFLPHSRVPGTTADSEAPGGSTTLSAASVASNTSEWDAYSPMMPTINGRPSSFVSMASTRSESSASFPIVPPAMGSRDHFDRLMAKAPARKSSVANMLLRKDKQKDKESVLHAFVFSDLVVLTSAEEGSGKSKVSRKSKSTSGANQTGFELIERVGLARIVKVTDHSGKCADRPHLLELEVLPLKVDSSYATGFDKRNVSQGPTTLFLAFNNAGSEGANATPTSKTPEAESALWYRALERSFLWSLRSRKRNSLMYSSKRESMMSLASSGNRAQIQTAHADWPRREKQVTDLVMAAARAGDAENLASLIQAGLPFPKSPSQQDLALFAGEELRITHTKLYGQESELSGPTGEASHIPVVGFGILDEAEEEREERRWWALRLSEVRQAAEAEREIDAMVKQLRSDDSTSSSGTSVAFGASPDAMQFQLHQQVRHPGATGGARRKVRQGLPVLRSGVSSDFTTSSSGADSTGSTAMSSLSSSDYRF
ncbi:hypothetical protein OC835_001435 [Tilletia horrida]|nr:hypothetical protein OC835_001435 [Tilletia horrida]